MGAIGVSVGPFKSDEDYRYIESVLKSFKFLALRDRTSYDLAIKMNLPYKPVLAADLAFILPSIQKTTNNVQTIDKKIIGVSLCHYERYISKDMHNEKRREDAIYTVLNNITKDKNIILRFFVINGNPKTGDLDITTNMIQKLALNNDQYELISYSPSTLETYTLISSCSIVFSTRLHGAIFAAAANVHSLLVEYHQKCTDYLDDIGIDKKWRIGDMDINTEDITSKIEQLLTVEKSSLYVNREKLIKLSHKNFIDETIVKEII